VRHEDLVALVLRSLVGKVLEVGALHVLWRPRCGGQAAWEVFELAEPSIEWRFRSRVWTVACQLVC
jgi:hypothetical protein